MTRIGKYQLSKARNSDITHLITIWSTYILFCQNSRFSFMSNPFLHLLRTSYVCNNLIPLVLTIWWYIKFCQNSQFSFMSNPFSALIAHLIFNNLTPLVLTIWWYIKFCQNSRFSFAVCWVCWCVLLAFTSNTGQYQNFKFLPHLEWLHCLIYFPVKSKRWIKLNYSCEIVMTVFTWGFIDVQWLQPDY